jgi:hypothetical protein
MRRKVIIDPFNGYKEEDAYRQSFHELHEQIYAAFEDHFIDLMTANIAVPEMSNRGKLNPRRLWRNSIDENIFDHSVKTPSSDTALVMLVDASSSMASGNSAYPNYSNFSVCLGIVSAFARANKELCDNAIRLEVFLKTGTSGLDVDGYLGQSPCFLTRAFTSTKNMNPLSIFGFTTFNPLRGDAKGSNTPEYAVLPALYQWAHDNITEPNRVLVNLTDGEPQYSRLRVSDLVNLRYKYLKGWQETAILLGDSWSDPDQYSDNPIVVDSDNFSTEMFTTLSTLMEEAL